MVITGTGGNDILVGTAGADTIEGLAGDDTLSGGAGGDTIDGGDGFDMIFAGAAGDFGSHSYYSNNPTLPTFDRGSEIDVINGGSGYSFISAGYGDSVDGGTSGALLVFSLMGAASGVIADFTLLDGGGSLVLGGGTLSNITTVRFIEGSAFADTIFGKNQGGDSPDIFGMGGDDRIVAGYYQSNLYGGDGDDVLDNRNSDYGGYLYGGAGNDEILTRTPSSAAFGDDGDDNIRGAWTARGGSGDDIITAGSGTFALGYYGDDGNDTLTVIDQQSSMFGGAGADVLNGGTGNDELWSHDMDGDFGTEIDQLSGGAGNDRLSIGLGDQADGGTGTDGLRLSLAGAASGVTVDFSTLAAGLTVAGTVIQNVEYLIEFTGTGFADTITLGNHTTWQYAKGGEGNDLLQGTATSVSLQGGGGNDTLLGTAVGDDLYGEDGNDLLNGGAGDDFMSGGFGDDRFIVDSAGDRVFETHGFDTVEASIDYVLPEGFEDLVLTGSAISGTGNWGINRITGTAAANVLDGGSNSDLLIGGAGNDIYYVDTAGDEVIEAVGEGSDEVRVSATYTLAAGQEVERLAVLASTGIIPVFLTGNEFAQTIEGNAGGNGLIGGGGDDVLLGHAGNDGLDGGSGDDSLSGGTGDDYYTVDSAGDTVIELAGEGTDTVQAFVTHTLAAHVEDLVLLGTDAINGTGNALANTITGNDAANTLTAIGGGDTLIGMGGNDSYLLSGTGDLVSELAGGGTDTVTAGFDYVLTDHVERLIMTGAAVAGTGNAEANEIFGTDGDNLIDGMGGADILEGGAGNDTYIVDEQYDSAVELAGGGFDTVRAKGSHTLTFGSEVEWLVAFDSDATDFIRLDGNELANSIQGNAGANGLFGLEGNDTLIGLGGIDMLDGGTGDDLLYGGQGDDTYAVDSLGDLVFEEPGQGFDTVVASNSHYLHAGVEALQLAWGGGDLFGVGNASGNVLSGNEGANLLLGGAGDDRVSGHGGNDLIFGEDGADELHGEAGIDFIAGGSGNDTLHGEDDADALYGEDGDDVLIGGATFHTDILVGGAGNDVLDGRSGQANPDYDEMDGGSGNDTYHVDTGADLTYEGVGGGTDTVYAEVTVPNAGVYLYANVENLVLQGTTAFGVGNELDNVLTGSGSGNWLLGGLGNDTLNGKGGNDVLFGEGGADTFVFETGTGGDVIGDFQAGTDRISLVGYGLTFAQVQGLFAQVGNVGAIQFANGDVIVLHNVTMANLTAADFIFG